MIEYTNVAGEVIKVTPFEDLPEQTRAAMKQTENWRIAQTDGDWPEIVDSRYGTIQHVAVTDDQGNVLYDKANLVWSPGAFIVPVRVNPQQKAEFLLVQERRILLRDRNGSKAM